MLASLIETCKLNAADPQAYLADVITRIVNGHPNNRLDELLGLRARQASRGLTTPLTFSRRRAA